MTPLSKNTAFRRMFAPILIIALSGSVSLIAGSKNSLLRGNSPESLGKGAAGIASWGPGYFSINPASIAMEERFGFALHYGTLDGSHAYPGIIAAVPTPYGVFGAAFRSLVMESSDDFEKGYLFSAGGAKEFTDHLAVGTSVALFHGSSPSAELNNLSLALGAIYSPGYSWNISHGFGVFDPSFGGTLSAGISEGDKKNSSNFNQLTLGYRFLFYRQAVCSTGFFNDVSFLNGSEDYRLKFGIESVLYRQFSVRAGILSPGHPDYSGVTMGAGYALFLANFEGKLDYALIFQEKSEIFHYLGLTIHYGELDRSSPITVVRPSERHISPNYDGRQDFVIFNISVQDQSRIRGWRMQILNSTGEIIREYRLSDRDVRERLTPGTFLKKIWQRRDSIAVPDSILWDGTDSRGRIVPDGKYGYSFMVWDERDNISSIKAGTVLVDNTAPAVELRTEDLLFSPNGDRNKDTLGIYQLPVTAPDDEWRAGFSDASGAAVKTYRWTGSEIPAKLTWDGRDDGGNEPPEGIYSYFLESTDRAGNTVKKVIRGITLTRHYETADVVASREYFSPPLHKDIRLFLSLSRAIGLEEWTVTIEDREQKAVKTFTGGTVLEKYVTWDGTDASGKTVRDGRYYYRFTTRFNSGNIPSSFEKEIVVDGAAPNLSVSYAPSLFSPDSDGENDFLTIFPGARDNTGLANWNLSIYSRAGIVFKTFQGTSAPASKIIWDGVNESGELVESAADYFIELEAFDMAGNYAKTARLRLPIDVLVIVTERGLKIRISNIEFAFNRSDLAPGAFPILGRVTQILSRYGAYDVLIEGHTDDIGEEEYNLTLSEQRAKSVMDFLIIKGIDRQRLSFRGMGESSAFLPNADTENRRRNRRVEFILIKKGAG